MKLYYNENELLNLSENELYNLISFEYSGEIYFYKDVQSIQISEGTKKEPLEWKVILNNNNFIYLFSLKELNNFKLKMTRFELLKVKINIDKVEDIISNQIIEKINSNIENYLNNELFNFKEEHKLKLKEINDAYLIEINKLINIKKEDFEEILFNLTHISKELNDLIE
jgi:hypothetical protein